MVHTFGASWSRIGRGLQIWNKRLMPVEEYEAHVAKVRAAMKKNNITTMLFSTHTQYFKSQAILIVPNVGPLVVVTPGASAPTGEGGQEWMRRRYQWVRQIIQLAENDRDLASREIRVVLDDLNLIGGTIGYVGFQTMPFQLISLKRELGESEFVNANQLMTDLLAVKSERELNLVIKAAELGDTACETLIKNAKPSSKNCILLAKIDRAVKLGGATDHKTALSTGADAEKYLAPGLLALDKELKEGDVVLYNACLQYHDYWAEIGRTITVGTASKKQTALYNAALTAQQAGITAVTAGAKASDVATAILQSLQDARYAQYLTTEYGLGHGVGLTFDEPPLIAEDNNTPLKAGMTIVVKVGLHAPGIGGTYLADTLSVTDNTAEQLTKTSYKLAS